MFKFNVDGSAREKPGHARIRGVLCNSKCDIIFMFSKHVGICDSNEAEVLAILEALRCFSRNILGDLIVESDSSNAITWTSKKRSTLRNFNSYLMKSGLYLYVLMSSFILSLDRLTRWLML